MTLIASVQTASDGSMSFGVVLTCIAGMALLYACLTGLAAVICRLEDRTRYDEESSDDAPLTPRRSWK